MTKVLDHGFIELIDHMGDDSAIIQAARVSYGKDEKDVLWSFIKPRVDDCYKGIIYDHITKFYFLNHEKDGYIIIDHHFGNLEKDIQEFETSTFLKDRNLIRYLMNHSHTTPFEMVEFKFVVQAPMDVMRQWIRHRTANVNEYSTRYTEAIDLCHSTLPGEWRLQATDNKQGSSGFLEEWPPGFIQNIEFIETDTYRPTGENPEGTPGGHLTAKEAEFHEQAKQLYQDRLAFGIAKEQARKDLPLSTYTRLYWKCDLHNIFNFLRLRMDSHAQWEIRQYANAMYELIKPIVPVACEAFEDYVLQAKKFSRMEMKLIKNCLGVYDSKLGTVVHNENTLEQFNKPSSMTDREWKEFLGKLS